MSYEEELYRRLTTGQGGSEARYLDRMSADTPAERDFLRNVMAGNVDANIPRVREMAGNMGLAERGVDTPAERDFLRNAMATGTPQAPQTPAPQNVQPTTATASWVPKTGSQDYSNLAAYYGQKNIHDSYIQRGSQIV